MLEHQKDAERGDRSEYRPLYSRREVQHIMKPQTNVSVGWKSRYMALSTIVIIIVVAFLYTLVMLSRYLNTVRCG